MALKQKFSDIFHPMSKDGGLLFVFLATLLVTISTYSTFVFRFDLWPLHKALLMAIPYAFAWVVIAWVITDKSILRSPYPYIGVFVALFFEKIYWPLFYHFYPPNYTNILSNDWMQTYDNAMNLFIVIEFIVAIVLFIIIWYLARPRDFMKSRSKFNFVTTKRFVLLMISGIFMTVPLWILRSIEYIGGPEAISTLFSYTDLIDWYNLLFSGIPIGISLVIFAYIITNINCRSKIALYLIIFATTLIPHVPMYSEILWKDTSSTLNVFSYFLIFAFLYFFLFLSLLLLSKRKYIEQ